MVELAEVPLREAIQMMTTTPARILQLDQLLGSLDQEKVADLVVLSADFSVLDVRWREIAGLTGCVVWKRLIFGC
jgi:N-acetylglucosamine-6-phosphate deacetylase